jgi:hypothetical protein
LLLGLTLTLVLVITVCVLVYYLSYWTDIDCSMDAPFNLTVALEKCVTMWYGDDVALAGNSFFYNSIPNIERVLRNVARDRPNSACARELFLFENMLDIGVWNGALVSIFDVFITAAHLVERAPVMCYVQHYEALK